MISSVTGTLGARRVTPKPVLAQMGSAPRESVVHGQPGVLLRLPLVLEQAPRPPAETPLWRTLADRLTGAGPFAGQHRLLLPEASSWLDSGMNKRETRAALLFMVIGLIATWSNAIFRDRKS